MLQSESEGVSPSTGIVRRGNPMLIPPKLPFDLHRFLFKYHHNLCNK